VVLHVLPPTNQPVLQQIRLMQVVKSCVKNLYMLRILPTQGKLVLQQALEVTPEYDMTPV